MKVWITGAQGLVGTALKNLCTKEGVDHVTTSHNEVDICSAQQAKRFLHSDKGAAVTHIINCAAYTNVDQAEKEPEDAYRVNVKGPENLGTIANSHGLHIIHLSSDYVFGITGDKPFTENDACKPASVYAKTKHEGEIRLLDAFPQACILRTSWVFGQGGKNFVSALLDKIQKEETIRVVTDQRNRATYAHDLAQTLLALVCHSGVFHFANQGEASRFEIAQKMVQIAAEKGMKVVCREVIGVDSSAFPQLAKRPVYSALDTKKIETLLGTQPRPWEQALKDFIYAL